MLNRRERRRRETYDEIVEVSRRLLNQRAERSVTAVATEIGISPPGLYRYVDSAEVLNALLAGQILSDVIDTMSVMQDRYASDPAAQLAATTATFRSWALAWPMEFQLVFATPRAVNFTGATGPLSLADAPWKYPSGILSDFFGEIFASLSAHGLIKVPPSTQMDPAVVEVVRASLTAGQRAGFEALGDDGPGTFWLLKLAWTRLYGVLTMEVFGQIDKQIIDSGLLFTEVMRETFLSLGVADDWDRLLAIARQVAELEDAGRVRA